MRPVWILSYNKVSIYIIHTQTQKPTAEKYIILLHSTSKYYSLCYNWILLVFLKLPTHMRVNRIIHKYIYTFLCIDASTCLCTHLEKAKVCNCTLYGHVCMRYAWTHECYGALSWTYVCVWCTIYMLFICICTVFEQFIQTLNLTYKNPRMHTCIEILYTQPYHILYFIQYVRAYCAPVFIRDSKNNTNRKTLKFVCAHTSAKPVTNTDTKPNILRSCCSCVRVPCTMDIIWVCLALCAQASILFMCSYALRHIYV